MSDVPMPRDLSEEAVAEWLWRIFSEDVHPGFVSPWDEQVGWRRTSHERTARAVRALVEAKVRECIAVTESRYSMPRFAPKGKAYGSLHPGATDDEIVSRVLGEEAPRG